MSMPSIQLHLYTPTRNMIWMSHGHLNLMTSSRELNVIYIYIYICRLCIIPLEFLGNTIKFCIRYADRINAYWTGYFTSRPAIKGYVRVLSGYYLVLEETPLFLLDHQGFLPNEFLNVKSLTRILD